MKSIFKFIFALLITFLMTSSVFLPKVWNIIVAIAIISSLVITAGVAFILTKTRKTEMPMRTAAKALTVCGVVLVLLNRIFLGLSMGHGLFIQFLPFSIGIIIIQNSNRYKLSVLHEEILNKCESLSDAEKEKVLYNRWNKKIISDEEYILLCRNCEAKTHFGHDLPEEDADIPAHIAAKNCQSCGETVTQGTVICPSCGSIIK